MIRRKLSRSALSPTSVLYAFGSDSVEPGAMGTANSILLFFLYPADRAPQHRHGSAGRAERPVVGMDGNRAAATAGHARLVVNRIDGQAVGP